MSDYTDLIQSLRCCATNKCESCPYEKKYSYRCATPLVMDAAAAIEALQAEVKRLEPKRGEWTEENRRPRSMQFVCSVCHRTAYDPQPSRDKAWRKRCRYAYCPNCGAKMEVQDGTE